MKEVYNFKDAAEFLGKHPQTLEHYQNKGWLVPDYRMEANDDRMYYEPTLVTFKSKYLESASPTIQEIAASYVKDGKKLSPATVHHHIRQKRRIEPNGWRGATMTFDDNTIIVVAREEGWVRPQLEDRHE